MFRLTAALLSAMLISGATTAAANTATFGGQSDLGLIEESQLDEISGVVASLVNPDVFWTLNDSGDANRIFAFNRTGTHLGEYELDGSTNIDWEEMAIGPGPIAGAQYLYVGDIGDNILQYGNRRIYRVPEPGVSASQSPVDVVITGVESITYTYPNGRQNAEAMIVDPLTKDIFIVSKSQTSTYVYRAPYPQSTTSTFSLQLVGSLSLTPVVSADISPSGEEILVKTIDAMHYWCRSPGEDVGDVLVNNAPTAVPYVEEPQGEAVAWDRVGLGYYTVSEEAGGVPARLYYYPRTDFVYANTDGLCVVPTSTCVTVPVEFDRDDTVDAISASVTIQIPSELALCGNQFVQGTWLNGFTSSFSVTDNGSGSYTIDQAITSLPCGIATGGTLFTVDVTGPSDAIAAITIISVDIRDCADAVLPGLPGPTELLPVDLTPPAAIADFTATPAQQGNGTDGTRSIDLSFTSVIGDTRLVEIYRHSFGDYPEYDNGSGVEPSVPATPGDAGWTLLTSLNPPFSTFTDEPTVRDYYYYTVFSYDTCGNVSIASNFGEALNYHLGDVSDGVTPGVGDNAVATPDLSALGPFYGSSLNFGDPQAYLDMGPTVGGSSAGRPLPDDQIDFEDLILLALNFGQVSKGTPSPTPATRNAITLTVPPTPAVGAVFDVPIQIESDGTLQGLSLDIDWDPRVVDWVGWREGSFLQSQARAATALSPRAGILDMAMLGAGSSGLSGKGTFALASFRVRTAGDPSIQLDHVVGRDATNQEVHVEGGNEIGAQQTPTVVVSTHLHAPSPNPFNPRTVIRFELGQSMPAQLKVYSATGRTVRILSSGTLPAGEHHVVWDGTDDRGARVASGAYLLRLETPERAVSHKLMLLK